MVDLIMGLVLAGIASGFTAWAGLLGDAKDFGVLMFFVFPALALAIALVGLGESLRGFVRTRRIGRTARA